MRKKERIVCGLDLGSWKACIVVVRVHPGGALELIDSGYSSSCGLIKSTIVNLEEAAASIRRAEEDLESRSEISADWVVAGISGGHIWEAPISRTTLWTAFVSPLKRRNA
jgi:cell division protein FtsA